MTTSSSNLLSLGIGPHAVGSTNMEVAPAFAQLGDRAMHDILLGRKEDAPGPRFVSEILRYPESAFITDVPIPNNRELYGPASDQTLPVVTYVTFPSRRMSPPRPYTFPYLDGEYGVFENMLGAGEAPRFADPDERYPLILLAHGLSAHGIYDVSHAHLLASHGYIVAVLSYGDDRTVPFDYQKPYVAFLRPLLTKAVLDSLLESEMFGAHIDVDNIGITGHSFGGFTTLALAGAPFQGNAATVHDDRIKAGAIAAPWVGEYEEGSVVFAFGPGNAGLNAVTAPMICFFGTVDEETLSEFILPGMKELSGDTYVVELVDQPHVFDALSWEARNHWELLFFAAYLKNDERALDRLKASRSIAGGDRDVQLFEYQRTGA